MHQLLEMEVSFLSPEIGKTTTVTHDIDVVSGPGVPVGLQIVHTPGNVATVELDWAPGCGAVGEKGSRRV